ncbi:MAG: ABC transporter permease [Acidimicrobiales bacterium]
MRRATIKGLLAHKLRLALTALAIVLGVTFVSGTFVLTDTLHSTFTTLFGQVYQNVSFIVRARPAFGTGEGEPAQPIPQSMVATVGAVPGVQYVSGSVEGYAQLVSPAGKAISNGGAPSLGVSWQPNSQLSSLHLVSGLPPTNAHEVAIDVATASKYHFAVGDRVRVFLPGQPQTFVLTGVVRFGTADNLAGATIAAFTLPTAQRLFGEVGKLDGVAVLARSGVNKAELQRAIAAVLPKGDEVVTGQTVANEQTNAINSALSFFSTALLVFAFISLFVGGFTIFNTFSIIVGQRTRELALLRVLGASRRQLFRSVLAEAGIVGLVSALVGLGLGVLTAKGLEELLKGFGVSLPTGSLVFEARTAVVALLVGVGVTVVSAISPARRAVRIAPVAALADYRGSEAESSRRRILVGGALGIAGIALLLVGLAVAHKIQLVGVGAVSIFIGVGMLAPVVARPLSSFLGRPLEVLGISGKLGRENSMRSPRRTAQTASALMVGLALVSAMGVFGASLSSSATAAVNNAVRADYIISSSSQGSGGFSSAVATAVAKVPGVRTVSEVYVGTFELRGSQTDLTALSTAGLASTVILNMVSGAGSPALGSGDMLVDTSTATADHLRVGSRVPVRFALTGRATMRIGGIYKANALLGSYLVGAAFYQSHFSGDIPVAVLVHTSDGPGAAGKAEISTGLRAFPGLTIQTRVEYEKAQQQQVNQLLGLVYALLALAILIALIGIVNTLLLSVFERTREIGLLRAVGMRRRQVKAMIRSEAVILAVFGAIIGIVIGSCLGVAFAWSLRSQGITNITVPIGSLVLFLVVAALLGLGAASWPARRAAKLDVLAAIAAD